jgi:hypothetical protein
VHGQAQTQDQHRLNARKEGSTNRQAEAASVLKRFSSLAVTPEVQGPEAMHSVVEYSGECRTKNLQMPVYHIIVTSGPLSVPACPCLFALIHTADSCNSHWML